MTASQDERRWGEAYGAGSHAGGASVGAGLRAERERLGWTLPAVATHLRIRQPFLEAIEEDRIGDLPGRAYAIGFVRTYAQALGLDPTEVADLYRAQAGEGPRKPELDFPAPVPDRGVPALAVVLVGVVVAIGAYAGWYRLSGNNRPSADAVQQVPERLAALVPERPAAAPTPSVAGPSGNGAATPSGALAASKAADPTASVATLGATGPVAAPTMPEAASTSPPATPAGVPPPSQPLRGAVPETPLDPAIAHGVVLRARGDAWLQVRERAGRVIMDRVFKAGETWPVPARPNLVLSTGNAGATEILVDGALMAPLGGSGAVRRDLPLDPDALKGKLAASAQSPSPNASSAASSSPASSPATSPPAASRATAPRTP